MWRRRNFILIGLLAVVVLVGSIGGLVFAVDNGDDEQTTVSSITWLDKVCNIYQENTGTAINAQELQQAFTEARNEIMAEARESFRQRLIEEGKITQEQLDEFDTWLESRPDIPCPFGRDNPEDIRPFGGRCRGFGGFDGGFPKWGGPCISEDS